MILYRPVGVNELLLIARTGFRRFPPRLPEQPFFYPVLTHAYAAQIAREWNTQDSVSGLAGFVMRFQVSDAFMHQYAVRTVGDPSHREYWIPAEDLERLNDHITAAIDVIDHFVGAACALEIDETTHLPRELDDLIQRRDQTNVWNVWRQDDNGNRFLVRSGITEEEARRLAGTFEARGHKQMYWTERQEPS